MEILEREERMRRVKKKEMEKMGKDGNELKYQFQTLYISIRFHLSEPGECGHIQETARAALRVAM